METGLNGVSMKLVIPHYIRLVVWAALVLGALSWTYVRWGSWWLVPLGAAAAVVLWGLVLVPLRVRALGWKETDDELVLARGRLRRTVTVIPYGRIQFVDVTTGPVGRALGLKSLAVNTASTSSISKLPGIEAAEADALRDRLAAKARERMSGL